MFGLEKLGLIGLFIGTFLAATIIPFSSDALYIAILAATSKPLACLVVGTAGNWLGSVTTYWLGRVAKWEWVEKTFNVKPESLENSKKRIDKYGVWTALLCWLPIVGDVIALALGFYKAPVFWSHVLMLLGKAGRFALWTLLLMNVF